MEFLCTDFVILPECQSQDTVWVVVWLIILGTEERMWLLDYEFVAYLHPLVVTDVLWVTDLQYELFYLPQFQLYAQILTEGRYTLVNQVLVLVIL